MAGPSNGAGTGRRWTRKARRDPMRARRNLMYLAPVPLFFTAFSGGALNLVTDLGALACLWGAAFLTSEGVRAEQAWAERPSARRPAIPRKLFGTVLTAAGVALATLAPGDGGMAGLLANGIVAPVLYGLTAAVLHLLAFGTDPWRDRNLPGLDRFQSERAARLVEEAERHISAMEAAIAPLHDRVLHQRQAQFIETARHMCRRLEDDPHDLTAARKYLGVYLGGAAAAAAKYAALSQAEPDPARAAEDRAAYVALLDDLEAGFTAQSARLLGDDRTDLSVEIDVLRERLAREGIAPERNPEQS